MKESSIASLSTLFLFVGFGKADDPPLDEVPKPLPVSASLVRSLKHPDPTSSISTVRFTTDGKLFATGYPSGIIQLFELKSGKEFAFAETRNGYRGTAHYAFPTPDFRSVFVIQDRTLPAGEGRPKPVRIGQVERWSLVDGTLAETLPPHTPQTGVLAGYLSPSGSTMVTVESMWDGNIDVNPHATILWNLKSKKSKFLTFGYSIAEFSPDETSLILAVFGRGEEKGRLVHIDLKSGKEKWSFHSESFNRGFSWPQLSPDGSQIVVLDSEGRIDKPSKLKLLNAATGAPVHAIDSPKNSPFMPPTFSPDGIHIVANKYSGGFVLWNVKTNRIVIDKDYPKKNHSLHSCFSPDGKKLVVGVCDEVNPQPTIHIFNTETFAEWKTLVAPPGYCSSFAFSADGKTLALGSMGAVHLFDLR